MSKKGISQIKGPSEIRLGETAYYEVSRIYDLDDKKKVDTARWKLHALDFKHDDNWRELKPKAGTPPKIGYRVPLVITNQSLVGSELMLEAYIYNPEKRIPPGLRIKVLPGIEKKITRVDLFKVDDTPIKDDTVMKYGQTIKVKVYTQNMQNEMMKLSLYEDDAQSGGDSPKNKNNRVAYIKKPLNKKGFLVHEFKLNANFAKIANAVMDGSHDKLHEYYVVVETAEHKSVSKNVEVQNPDYVKVQTVSSHGVDTEKIYEGITIEEVVITVKLKNQVGTNPPVDTGNKVATVAKPDDKKEENKCACQQYDLIWGDKVSCEFRKKVVEICADLWGEDNQIKMANGLMAVMKVETSGTFKAHQIMGKSLKDVNSVTKDDFWMNSSTKKGGSRAVGLIQFTQTALEKMGEFKSGSGFDKLHEVKLRFAKMGEVAQLDKVKDYFEPQKKKIKTPEDIYLAVFAPAGVGKGDDYPLYVKGTTEYAQNKSVDAESEDKKYKNDGVIQRVEILGRYRTSYTQGLSEKEKEFNCGGEKLTPVQNVSKKSNSKVKLDFVGKTAKESALSEKTKNVLRAVGEASANYYIAITSTARTPYDQARIMYNNCKSDLREQRRVYKPPGQRVIDVYENNEFKSREIVIKLMEQKIIELGPSTVSKHLANPEVLNTFDISYGNLSDKTRFWNEMKKRPELDDMLVENKCYHVQIKQK